MLSATCRPPRVPPLPLVGRGRRGPLGLALAGFEAGGYLDWDHGAVALGVASAYPFQAMM